LRFSAYLDELDEWDELDKLPEAIDCPDTDRFSLVVELAALKNEVKLESRQVKTALELFRDTFEVLRQAHSQLETSYAKQREQETQTCQETERSFILELLELRDRLQAGHEQLSSYRPNWWAKQGKAGEYVAEVAVGQAMLLRRLDETLVRRKVVPLTVLGQRFDPKLMHAVHTVQDTNSADGVVVAEIRSGFLYDKQLLRPAEVTVNKIVF
jgi:molecular chaperone GrpE